MYPSTLYFGERRHMNTVLEKTTDMSAEAEVVKETVGSCPMSILYFRTYAYFNEIIQAIEIEGYGTAFRYNREGLTVGALILYSVVQQGYITGFIRNSIKYYAILFSAYMQVSIFLKRK